MTRRQRRVSPAAMEVLTPKATKGPMWHNVRATSVSASEIAVICGVSPYGSAFDLWHHKYNGTRDTTETRQQSRGSRVEPLVLDDWAAAHPELWLRTPVGLCRNIERRWQVCTPDGLVFESRNSSSAIGCVEAKTAGGNEGWGRRGTDEIPVHYRAQVLWQMDTLGVSVAYVPVWIGFDFREYVVEYDPLDVAFMREQALAFLESVRAGTPPDIDAHPATTDRLKKLHPALTDDEATVPAAVVKQYQAASQLVEAATERMRLAENRMRAAMGKARYAIDPDTGRRVASRSVYDVDARTQEVKPYTVDKLTVRKHPRTRKTIR